MIVNGVIISKDKNKEIIKKGEWTYQIVKKGNGLSNVKKGNGLSNIKKGNGLSNIKKGNGLSNIKKYGSGLKILK